MRCSQCGCLGGTGMTPGGLSAAMHPRPLTMQPPPLLPLHACRFEVEFSTSLSQALQALGIRKPFEGGDITQVGGHAQLAPAGHSPPRGNLLALGHQAPLPACPPARPPASLSGLCFAGRQL